MGLSDRNLQLLTAFVDGQLSNRERKATLRLLHRSSEARAMLGELQENAHRLKELPRHTLGPDFAGRVVEAIKRGRLKPAPTPILRRLPRWLKFSAVAACVLLAQLTTQTIGADVRRPPAVGYMNGTKDTIDCGV